MIDVNELKDWNMKLEVLLMKEDMMYRVVLILMKMYLGLNVVVVTVQFIECLLEVYYLQHSQLFVYL